MGNPWFGSKAASGLWQALVSLMPPHAVYIETHLGGGAVMRRKPGALRNIGIDLDARALSSFVCDYPVELVRGDCHAHLSEFPFDGSEPVYSDPPYLQSARKSSRRLGGRTPVALDGTEFFRSRNIDCPNCSTRKRADGATGHFHQMLAATLVAPGHARTLPLPPEFLAPRRGAAKQDCEREAAKRRLQRHGPRCAALRPVHPGDDLYACQPICQAMLDSGGDFLPAAKPASHKTLYEYLRGIGPHTRRAASGKGARRRIHRHRWMSDLPIRGTGDALRVNWLEIQSAKPDGTVTYRGSFVTSLPVNRDNVAELAQCARARWKIENETFNVLKQHGHRLEHNFGHGKTTLASVLVALNLPAFAPHTACELAETLWQQARLRLGARQRLFEHLRSITAYQVFPTWTALMTLLATGHAPPRPP